MTTTVSCLPRLARAGALLCLILLAPAAHPAPDVLDVSVSFAGRQIAWTTAEHQLTILDAASSGSQALEIRDLRPGGLAWSPNGDRLAVTLARPETGGSWDLAIVNRADGVARPVAPHGAREWAPVFSADGNWLYFCSTRGGDADIYRVQLASGAIENFVALPYDQVKPRLSVDDIRLACLSYERGYPGIVLTDTLTGQIQNIPFTPPADAGPVVDLQWAPRGHDTLWLVCRLPERASVIRVNLNTGRQDTVLVIEGEVGRVAPLIDGGFLYQSDGVLRSHSPSALARVMPAAVVEPTLPEEQGDFAVDPRSGSYVAVVGGRFITFGTLGAPGFNVSFRDAGQALEWSLFLADHDRRAMAIDQLRAVERRAGLSPTGDDARLGLARALRDDGRTIDAWKTARGVFDQAAEGPNAHERRGRAARLLGEIALFDYGDPDTARNWFKAAHDFIVHTRPDYRPWPHLILDEIQGPRLAAYRQMVLAWRDARYGSAARQAAKLARTGPMNDAVAAEMRSLFLDQTENNFFRPRPTNPLEALIENEDSLAAQARVAEAYTSADGAPRRDEALEWLSAAQQARGKSDLARHSVRKRLESGIDERSARVAFLLLGRYATNAGQDFRRGRPTMYERRGQALLNAMVEETLLASAIKDEFVFQWSQASRPVYHVMPDMAAMRAALKRGDFDGIAREQRYLTGELQRVAERDKNKEWRLMAMLAAGFTAEAHLARGNWLDARTACETALRYDPSEVGEMLPDFIPEYQAFLLERLALLSVSPEFSSTFSRVMEIEAEAVNACLRDPVNAPIDAWRRALQNYVALLKKPESASLKPALLYLMADAYAAQEHPVEQVVAALRAALATRPPELLDRAVRQRLTRIYEELDDPYIASAYRVR